MRRRRPILWITTILGIAAIAGANYALQLPPQEEPSPYQGKQTWTLDEMRATTLKAQLLEMNYLRPGCGTGWEEQSAAGQAVHEAGKKHPQIFARMLSDKDPAVRASAAILAAHIEDATLLPPLRKCVSDKNEDVRLYAISALHELKDAKSVDLVRPATKDKDIMVRAIAYRYLVGRGVKVDKKALRRLIKRADDGPKWRAKHIAEEALQAIK